MDFAETRPLRGYHSTSLRCIRATDIRNHRRPSIPNLIEIREVSGTDESKTIPVQKRTEPVYIYIYV